MSISNVIPPVERRGTLPPPVTVDSLDQDLHELSVLEAELGALAGTHATFTNHGVSATALTILKSMQLLGGTSLDAIAVESLATSGSITISESAVESILGALKDKAASWGAKVIATVEKAGSWIVEKLGNLFDAVTEKAKALMSASWDKTKEIGESAKAHPYKTLMIVLGAAAAVAGIVVFVGTGLPTGAVTNGQMAAFMTRLQTMYKGINWPFGKVTTNAVSAGRLVTAKIDAVKTAVTGAGGTVVGWGKDAVGALVTQIDKIKLAIKKGLGAISDRLWKPAKKAFEVVDAPMRFVQKTVTEKTGSKVAGWGAQAMASEMYYNIVWKLISNVFQMIKTIVVKTIEMVKSTFNTLTSAFA